MSNTRVVLDGEEVPAAKVPLRAAVPGQRAPAIGEQAPDGDGPPPVSLVKADRAAKSSAAADAAPTSDVRGHRRRTRYAHALRRIPPPRQAVTGAIRAARAWTRRPGGRLALPGLLLLVLLAGAAVAGAYLIPATAGPARPRAEASVAGPTVGGSATGTPDPGASLPAGAFPSASPSPGANSAGRPADVLAGWAQQMSGKVDVPPVAVQAYGYAELVINQTTPGCRLSWTTLAAIGKVESNHGRVRNASMLSDGRAVPAIVGDPLDGKGGRGTVRDTDAGALDGDKVYDRAVGPMQFIPGTWRTSAVDADDDGLRDPNDVDDAALAAANYLCRGARDMTNPAHWRAAILAYNNVAAYADAVFAAANDYGLRSRT